MSTMENTHQMKSLEKECSLTNQTLSTKEYLIKVNW